MSRKHILAKIEALTSANVNIGYYDALRYQEAARPKDKADKKMIYFAARRVRKINEERSRLKNELDEALSRWIR